MGRNNEAMRISKTRLSGLIPYCYFVIISVPVFLFVREYITLDILRVFTEKRTAGIMLGSVLQSSITVVIALVISWAPAVYLSKKDNIISRFLESTLFIPFFYPAISVAVTFIILLKDTDLNHTLFSIILAHVFYNSPLFVKYISESLSGMSNELNDIAELDGISPLRRFTSVTLHYALPGILKGGFLVFTYAFTSFAVILLVGNSRFTTYEIAIAEANSLFQPQRMIAYGIIQYLTLFALNMIVSSIKLNTEKTPLKTNYHVNKIITCGAIFYLIFEILIIVIPFIYPFINGGYAILLKIFSFDFNKKFPVIISIINSLILSIISGLIITALSFIILKNRSKLKDTLIFSTIGVSGAFISIIMLYINITYGIPSVALYYLGVVVITLPIASSLLFDKVVNFPAALIEQARSDGAGSATIFFRIELPLLGRTLLSNVLQIFTIVYGEFTIAYTMGIGRYLPLASTVSYSLASRRMLNEASALSCFNIILITTIFVISGLIPARSKSR